MGGWITRCFGKEEVRVIIQGLDAAGKTTMLYRLKLGEVVTTIPTIGFNVETIEHKNVSITAWDIGGRDKMRALNRHYYQNTDAMIFVVDSNDRDRLDVVKEELTSIMSEDELKGCPLLVVANKQDLSNPMSVIEIQEKLGLNCVYDRQCMVVPAVATTGDGLYEGLDWLSANIGKQKAIDSVKKPVSDTVSAVSESVSVSSSYITKTVNIIKGLFKS